MTKQKDFKKRVRARMEKTGERYAAARAKLIAAGKPSAGSASADRCGGVQTETGALCNLLNRIGLRTTAAEPLSENLVFALCGGIGFLYAVFEYAGHPPMLTIGTRAYAMPDRFVAEGLGRVPATVAVHETGSAAVAQKHLDAALSEFGSALCTVDAASLPYYGIPAEQMGMGPHVVGVVGKRGGDVLLDDRGAEPIAVSEGDFAKARAGYRRGKHRLVTISEPQSGELVATAILDGLRHSISAYDTPPAKPFASNIGTAGLEKWARLLGESSDKKAWSKVFASGSRAYVGLRRAYDCTQHAYSAPGGCRLMFASALEEISKLTGATALAGFAGTFEEIGERWKTIGERIAGCDPTVARGCQLSDRRVELLDERGGAAAAEMSELYRERRALADECNLEQHQSAAIFASLSEIVADIAAREKEALGALRRALSG